MEFCWLDLAAGTAAKCADRNSLSLSFELKANFLQ